jgi:hypothetical protein
MRPPLPAHNARSMAKPASRLPTVITATVIFVVAVVVAAASLVAHFADTQVAAPFRRSRLKEIGSSSPPATEAAN